MPIYNYTGNGEGKTSAALGKSLRYLGNSKKVIIIQYMKGRKTGELNFQNKLEHYRIYQFGAKSFIDADSLKEKDKSLAKKGLEFISEAVMQKPKLLILDEINTAVSYGLLTSKEVVEKIKKVPKSIDIILTGRDSPNALINISDCVMEIKEIKRTAKYFQKGMQY